MLKKLRIDWNLIQFIGLFVFGMFCLNTKAYPQKRIVPVSRGTIAIQREKELPLVQNKVVILPKTSGATQQVTVALSHQIKVLQISSPLNRDSFDRNWRIDQPGWNNEWNKSILEIAKNDLVNDDIFVLGRDAQSQLIYLIDTGEGLLLIDPSYDSWHELLLSQIKQLGYSSSQVRWILITHCHIDHAQSCHLWRKKGAQIIAPQYDAHPIETGNQVTAWWLMKGKDRSFHGCPVDREVHDGDRLDFGSMTFYAIWTPGHTPGSTCYLLKHKNKQILFSQDIALHNGRHAWMAHPYADWDQYLKSLEKLGNFRLSGRLIRYDLLLPGHGVVELEGAMRSVKETIKLVRHIVERRKNGEPVTWVEPYRWNWENKVTYKK